MEMAVSNRERNRLDPIDFCNHPGAGHDRPRYLGPAERPIHIGYVRGWPFGQRTHELGGISGEYLSAASFMGVAGMVMKFGYDVLWYPTLYAAGYLFLLLFIASPLRRFGAYTIPDFAGAV